MILIIGFLYLCRSFCFENGIFTGGTQIFNITVEYEPPADLLPAEIQYMLEVVEQPRVVAATIIDLVQRGFLHMKKKDNKKWLYAGPQVSSNLTAYEFCDYKIG